MFHLARPLHDRRIIDEGSAVSVNVFACDVRYLGPKRSFEFLEVVVSICGISTFEIVSLSILDPSIIKAK